MIGKGLTGCVLGAALFCSAGQGLAQSNLTEIGWCRDDGIAGGTVERTRGATHCNINTALAAARNSAIAAAEAAAANACPTPISTANAQNRCSAAGSFFAPTAIPNVQVQQSQGATAAERAATHLKRVGNSGICTYTRVIAEREQSDLNDRSCGIWPFRYNRRTVLAEARAACGVICR
ncbi:hypothetical protein [Rhodovulum steppense]|uniref:YARHG domain-containing protein n=1 Tax=Rhodovulum steppense TaxID=540251 RepID=A0A4R1YSR3_9RHOB|nr:hypothetical protein [Rhodovulum steppense]TCM82676.1 hypothetical protein EV216_11539 [Rhodovulum steppense]